MIAGYYQVLETGKVVWCETGFSRNHIVLYPVFITFIGLSGLSVTSRKSYMRDYTYNDAEFQEHFKGLISIYDLRILSNP